MNMLSSDTTRSPEAIAEAQRGFVTRVFGWMTLGLVITALAAWYTTTNQNLQTALLQTPWLWMVLLVVQLGLVVVLSAWVAKLTVATARVAFIAYAALTGVTFSVILLMYTAESVSNAFAVSAGVFGLMALYGYTTGRDLTAWRNLLLMGLLGVIIASVVNLFLASGPLYFVISIVAVLVFVGLTAHDTQRLKRMAVSLQGDEMVQRASILGALILYLDFINLFLALLRLMGRRR
jgi:FtsH-binding integral membrane protein